MANLGYKPNRGQPFSVSNQRFNPMQKQYNVYQQQITTNNQYNLENKKLDQKVEHKSDNESINNDVIKKCELCDNVKQPIKEILCAECDELVGCDECWCDNEGTFCAECQECWCVQCSIVKPCDKCLELYCLECGDFKPGKNGIEQCHHCQPWWMHDRPATDFCSGCGSSRSNANYCFDCEKRYCTHCIGFYCQVCHETFKCEMCNDMKYCETHDINYCLDCGCDKCSTHSDDDE